MKSSSEIRMDFKKSVRYAEKLDRLAKGLREETGYYETLSFWEGEAASVCNFFRGEVAFLQEGKCLLDSAGGKILRCGMSVESGECPAE